MSASLNKALSALLRLLPVPSLTCCWGVQAFSGSSWEVPAVARPVCDKGASFCPPQRCFQHLGYHRGLQFVNHWRSLSVRAELHLGRNSAQGSSQHIPLRRGAFCCFFFFFKKLRLSALGLYSAWRRSFASHGQLYVHLLAQVTPLHAFCCLFFSFFHTFLLQIDFGHCF